MLKRNRHKTNQAGLCLPLEESVSVTLGVEDELCLCVLPLKKAPPREGWTKIVQLLEPLTNQMGHLDFSIVEATRLSPSEKRSPILLRLQMPGLALFREALLHAVEETVVGSEDPYRPEILLENKDQAEWAKLKEQLPLFSSCDLLRLYAEEISYDLPLLGL